MFLPVTMMRLKINTFLNDCFPHLCIYSQFDICMYAMSTKKFQYLRLLNVNTDSVIYVRRAYVFD